MPHEFDDWISAADASRYLGVSRPRVHQLVKVNALDGRRKAGRLFIHRHGLEVWARSRELRRRWKPENLVELRMKRSEILSLAAAHGAGNVRIFGSVARGTPVASSDLDIVVDMEEGRNALDVCELMVDLEDVVGRTVDLVTHSSSARLREVLTKAVPL